jgi:dynein heavy chain
MFFMQGSVGELREWEDKPDYLEEKTWARLKNLQGIHYNYDEICETFVDPAKIPIWQSIMDAEDPLTIDLPIQKDFYPFQSMLIYYILCEAKLMQLVKKFVSTELGKTFIESPPFDLKASYDDSDPKTPIIFILSSGADPMSNLLVFAKSKEMDGPRFKILSLGQGQGEKAEELIKTARLNGDWVCLQNCHLATSWMADLERIQETQAHFHEQYRLWLTSMPSTSFPVPVLQSGIKLTNEPPRGIKANIGRSYLDIDEEWYNGCSKDQEFKKMFFGLCLFHAIILERKKYGAIGWNIPYGWMNSDLETCQMQLKMYIEEQPEVPYDTLRYLVAVIGYGGRITDQRDERLISAIYRTYCNEAIIASDSFAFDPEGIYQIPRDMSLEGIRTYIADLPLDDKPEIFGLHANASLVYSINTCKDFVDFLVMIQPKVSSGGRGAQTPEEMIKAQLTDFEKRLPEQMKLAFDADTASSLHIFRIQEVDRFNILIKGMRKHMAELKLAIDGKIVMSVMLERMFNAMSIKKVPSNWEDIAYPSLKPIASWFTDLVKRLEFIKKWVDEDYLPAYWVSSFFFPQGFMTAALQTYARKTKIPIDKLVFKTIMHEQMGQDITEGPDEGVFIYGHFLEGCKWDTEKKTLCESVKDKLFQVLPAIHIFPL